MAHICGKSQIPPFAMEGRQLGQFKGLAELTCGWQMRSPAEVLPRALAIDSNVFSSWNRADNLSLISLANFQKMGNRVIAIPNLAHNRLVTIDDLFHFVFDGFKIIRTKRFIAGKIIKETIFNDRANRYLCARK